jgi:hypothetical protein
LIAGLVNNLLNVEFRELLDMSANTAAFFTLWNVAFISAAVGRRMTSERRAKMIWRATRGRRSNVEAKRRSQILRGGGVKLNE